MDDQATDVLPSTCVMYRGDCLDVMLLLKPKSVQMMFADLPYGTTDCAWDSQIDLNAFWISLDACTLSNATFVFTATQPFATDLIGSKRQLFKYDLILPKANATGFLHAKRRPMRAHEHVLIFQKNHYIYNPQKTFGHKAYGAVPYDSQSPNWAGLKGKRLPVGGDDSRHPRSILDMKSEARCKSVHPTQKPVALLEWLIKTYTNPGDTVLDPVFGSCTTGVACARLGRNFVGIEKDAEYFRIGAERVNKERTSLGLPGAVLHS